MRVEVKGYGGAGLKAEKWTKKILAMHCCLFCDHMPCYLCMPY